MQDHEIILHCAEKHEPDSYWDAPVWRLKSNQLWHETIWETVTRSFFFFFVKTLFTFTVLLWWTAVKMETQNYLSHLHKNRAGPHKAAHSWRGKTACARNPHKDTLFLPVKWRFSLMSFLQLLLSLIAPPGPYYPTDSKATCSRQRLWDFDV